MVLSQSVTERESWGLRRWNEVWDLIMFSRTSRPTLEQSSTRAVTYRVCPFRLKDWIFRYMGGETRNVSMDLKTCLAALKTRLSS